MSLAETNNVSLEQERLRAAIHVVIASKSPVHENILCNDVGKSMGTGRVSGQLRTSIMALAGEIAQQTQEDVGLFFWSKEQVPTVCKTFRKRGKDEKVLPAEIAMQELTALARTLRPTHDEDPIKLLAHKLGIQRVHSSTRARLEEAWRRK